MPNNRIILLLCFFLWISISFAQDDDTILVVQDTVNTKKKAINPLSPSKAAFYSAVLPGLGQAYNKKYWKIPIVYAALGTGIYFYIDNNNKYNRYRDAYKRRLAGFSDDEFIGVVTDTDALIDAQEFYQKNRDLSLLLTVVAYVLNIIDANVDAHLLQFNVNSNLSMQPGINQNDVDFSNNVGLTFNFRF